MSAREFLCSYLTVFTGLPPDTRSEDVSKFFDGYGRIVDVRVMTGKCSPSKNFFFHGLSQPLGFGFVEFENPKVGQVYRNRKFGQPPC